MKVAALAVPLFLFLYHFGASADGSKSCHQSLTQSSHLRALLQQAYVGSAKAEASVLENSRRAIRDHFGTKDSEVLFGHHPGDWPTFLGKTQGDHLIVGKGSPDDRQIYVMVYKRLPESVSDYRNRLRTKGAEATSRWLSSWLGDMGTDFDAIVRAYAKSVERRAHLWIMSDHHQADLQSAVVVHGLDADVMTPWLARHASVYAPKAGGVLAQERLSVQVEPLIQDLLKGL